MTIPRKLTSGNDQNAGKTRNSEGSRPGFSLAGTEVRLTPFTTASMSHGGRKSRNSLPVAAEIWKSTLDSGSDKQGIIKSASHLSCPLFGVGHSDSAMAVISPLLPSQQTANAAGALAGCGSAQGHLFAEPMPAKQSKTRGTIHARLKPIVVARKGHEICGVNAAPGVNVVSNFVKVDTRL
jgi:hypothetical protein